MGADVMSSDARPHESEHEGRHFATCDACAKQGSCRYDENEACICIECDLLYADAVERAAKAIYESVDAYGRPATITWEQMLTYDGKFPDNTDHPVADNFRRMARDALTAASLMPASGDTQTSTEDDRQP